MDRARDELRVPGAAAGGLAQIGQDLLRLVGPRFQSLRQPARLVQRRGDPPGDVASERLFAPFEERRLVGRLPLQRLFPRGRREVGAARDQLGPADEDPELRVPIVDLRRLAPFRRRAVGLALLPRLLAPLEGLLVVLRLLLRIDEEGDGGENGDGAAGEDQGAVTNERAFVFGFNGSALPRVGSAPRPL